MDFFYSPEPVALGTALFASIFLCTDILSEHFGREKARKNVLIGFASFLFMTIIMLITIGLKPSTNDWAQDSLANVFTPMSRFFIASMIAYLASQYFDVWIYSTIKNITKNRYLWLRNNLSTILSSLVDNTIFSLLAWIILNPNPETLYNVIMIYILGTYILRIFIALIDTPFIYLSKAIAIEGETSVGALMSILRFLAFAASSVVFPYTAIRVLFCSKSGKFLNKDSMPNGLKKTSIS